MTAPAGLTPLPAAALRAALAADAGNPLLAFAPGAAEGPVVSPASAAPGASGVSTVDGGGGLELPRGAGHLVDAVAAWLGVAERRVAASLVVLGYSARLLGPTVRLAHAGIAVDARPAAVRYSFAAGVGFRLSLVAPAGWAGPPEAVAAHWCREVVDDHLTLLIDSVRADTPVAAPLLWGNVASGLVGAAKAAGAGSFLAAALEHGPLRGAGSFAAGAFVRRTCCLYYRLPGGGYCGDCPLPRTPSGTTRRGPR
ncbi:hypothetical protein Val02_45120 [Virgisporangium aliadipatigenens]|uniref:Ferric siderophore reductase C-terminal domain-containing protein n=1 Tax=Virgisporangium aliadipatigenens TaxID=741659 RepID=A0A8J3YLY2_9ACTN|nr:(2Fe-2S)-binding protein [Virgisporangium aliadipatigenens]GIJ47626.1 hypothetical protein Val02_45120 [Virgisporangium aliadipatigenens]